MYSLPSRIPEYEKKTFVINTYPHLIQKIDALVKLLEEWLEEMDKENNDTN